MSAIEASSVSDVAGFGAGGEASPPAPDLAAAYELFGAAPAIRAEAQPRVTVLGASGDADVDSLLTGVKWGGGASTAVTLTYSFQNASSTYTRDDVEHFNNFREFSPAQKAAARESLAYWSQVANVTFVEVADNAAGHGAIRFGRSDEPLTAYAYYPATEDYGGDVWLGNVDHGSTQSYPKGSYYFQTLLHEIGHALGFAHPHEGLRPLPAGQDWLGTSVMTYRSFPNADLGSGYSNEFYPARPMLNDIEAIQYLYGANKTFHAGDDVYAWATGQRLFETIYDAGGEDTIDWSNQSSAALIDLRLGAWSELGPGYTSYALAAPIRTTLAIARNTVIENAKGGSGNDTINGNGAANKLDGNGGADKLYGYASDDILTGGTGNDGLYGSTGNDSYVFGTGFGHDLISDISGNDRIVFTEIAAGQASFANLGGDLRVTVNGEPDHLDVDGYFAQAGRWTITYGSAATTLFTAGNDAVNLGNVNLALFPGALGANALAGNDIVTLSSTQNRGVDFHGGTGNDTLTGTGGVDRLFGDDGNDLFRGLAGADRLDGGAGSDTVSYVDAAAVVTASLATATGTATGVTDSLVAIENLTGGVADDRLTGNGGANVLAGMGGNDALLGGGGNDVLNGGLGKDTQTGGAGNDRFVFTTAADSPVGGGRDVLTDFTHGGTAATGDKIDVAAIDANSGMNGNQAFVWKGAAALAGAAQAHYATTGGVRLIQFSTDGHAAPEFEIQIPGAFTPQSLDLVL